MPKNNTQPYEILPNDETHLWRYMSIPKFLSLIQSSELYFHRADKFRDIYEGSFTQGSLNEHIEEWSSSFSDDLIFLSKRIPSFSFVSCWHISKYESAALWEIYGAKEGAVAIQTTVGALKGLFSEITEKKSGTITCQQIAKVQYIDYKTEHPHINDLAGPLCFKRKAYSYEKEVRVIRMLLPTVPKPTKERPDGSAIDIGRSPEQTGLSISVDLNSLITSVYVSPSSPEYVLNTMRDIMGKYDIQAICKKSSLDELPEFWSVIT